MACAWIQPVTATYSFINPASHGGQTSFANNNVYAEKAILEVQWTVGATDEDATVVLWQVNTTSTTASNSDEPEFIGDLEYLAGALAPPSPLFPSPPPQYCDLAGTWWCVLTFDIYGRA